MGRKGRRDVPFYAFTNASNKYSELKLFIKALIGYTGLLGAGGVFKCNKKCFRCHDR